MVIVDKTQDCVTGKEQPLAYDRLTYIVIHRISLARRAKGNLDPIPDSLLDAPALAQRFRDRDLGTGGKPPYHFLVRQGGTIEQLLPLSLRGAHAVGYNNMSVGVAVVGDFRHQEPQVAQLTSLEALCAAMVPVKRNGLLIVGHTQVPGSSHDETKICPGAYLNIPALVLKVRNRLQEQQPGWRAFSQDEARRHLVTKGIRV